MTQPTRHIAMWSGPRNISTAMMRSFGNRNDCLVIDEPFYAAYLRATGLDHPMRNAILAAGQTDWRLVAEQLGGPPPAGLALTYQKHMTHHMIDSIGRGWMAGLRHAFLIRRPENVLASYAAKRVEVTLNDIGFVQQAELFDEICNRQGAAPPVVDAMDVLSRPREILTCLCAALDIRFTETMLNWPAGRRATDGVWAAHWYGAVDQTTGFMAPPADVEFDALPDKLKPIAEAARPHYQKLSARKLTISA